MTTLLLAVLTATTPQPLQATVVAREYQIDAPEIIAGPLIDVRFENTGREPHYLRFLQLGPDRTLEDFISWRKSGGTLPAGLRSAGGVGTIAPKQVVEFQAVLAPGRYVVMCGHPSPDGTPHVDKGMYRLITVSGRGSESRPLADMTLLLTEKTLELFGSPRPGPLRLLLTNTATAMHQALLVRLPDGVTAEQELEWFRSGFKGSRPGVPVGGAIELLPGEDLGLRLDLLPGRYIVFCSVVSGGRRHFDDGMVATFEVR